MAPEMSEEQALLPGHPPAVQRGQESSRSLLRSKYVAVAGFAALAFGAVAGWSAGSQFSSSQLSAASSEAIKISVTNKYSAKSGKHPGKLYSFLEYGTVVEPMRQTKLEASYHNEASPRSIQAATWHVVQRTNVGNGPQVEHHEVENEVTLMFKHLGEYHVALKAVDDTGLVTNHEATLNCLYVRRELRTLDEQDLGNFMGAMMAIYSVQGREGKMLYGPLFQDSAYFASMHLNYAGDRDCDHMHDGMGFITQHLALTSEFEQALQAVDPSVTIPYWDYTIDRAMVDAGNWSNIWDSDAFSANYFGSTDESIGGNLSLTSSRWAHLTVPYNSSGVTTNAYGYLRAPWNVNKSPYVTRSQTVCGVKEWDSWPSCQTHYDVTFSDAYDSWYNYVWEASYTPHGPIHSLIGGYTNCETELDQMAVDLGIDNSTAAKMKYKVITYLKGAWRSYLVAPPTCSMDVPQDECHMQCTSDPKVDSTYREKAITYLKGELSSTGMTDTIDDWTDEEQATFVKTMICSTSYVSGDQLEAGSPSDPSFWAIHPTVDRLLQFKHISNEFANEDWGNAGGTTNYCTTGTDCVGHHIDDLIPFKVRVLLEGNYTNTYLTNGDLYTYSHPENYALPYIYDNFDWEHCAQQGFDFSTQTVSRR